MLFLIALIVDGALAGTLYALIALAFVVAYKTSRIINFALGEWMLLGSRLVAVGLHTLGLGLLGALGPAAAGMVALALVWNRVVLRRLVGQPLVSLLMVTLGLGAVMRGAAALLFSGVPGGIPLPIVPDTLAVHGVMIPTAKLVAAIAAAVSIGVVTWFFQRSRTGLSLRALADNPPAAMAVGVDIDRYGFITWAMVGVLSVVAGTLWTSATGGAFSAVLLGLKVFPIVVIGGLDSIPGCIVGALLVGVLESLAAGYLDPLLGAGFSGIASFVVLVAMLCARPFGLFGQPLVERV